MKKAELSTLAGLCLAIIFTLCADTSAQAEKIRNETLRLHIIADDDSSQAQNIKLAVKDSISSLCAEICCPAENIQQATDLTRHNLDRIKQAADHTLSEQGADYTAACSIEQFYFDTTEYENFTLPAGNYTALTIRLGKAAGTNWWCVAYPALCVSARAEYRDDASNTFVETDSFRLKFRVVELVQDIKHFFKKDMPEYTSLP